MYAKIIAFLSLVKRCWPAVTLRLRIFLVTRRLVRKVGPKETLSLLQWAEKETDAKIETNKIS